MKLNNIMIERVEKIPFYIQPIFDHSENSEGSKALIPVVNTPAFPTSLTSVLISGPMGL